MEGALDDVALRELIAEARSYVLGLGIAAARMIGMLGVSPILRRAELGRLLTATLAVALALPIWWGVGPALAALEARLPAELFLLAAKELLLGAFLGLLLALPFYAVAVVGDLIDTQRSIGQSGVDDPITKEQTSVVSSLLMLAVITTFVLNGGLQILTGTIYDSYAAWPLDRYVPTWSAASRDALLGLLARLIWFGTVVAGPFVVLFLLSDFAFAGLARLAGRIDMVSSLPLVKNVLFCLFMVVWLDHTMGYLVAGLSDTRTVLDVLEAFLP